jgi:hypothetical protein
LIYINLTYGFGNNLFQFHFGRILSKKFNLKFFCVGKVSIHFDKFKGELPNKYKIIRDNYKNGRKKDFEILLNEISSEKENNILLLGFFEYRSFFIQNQREIIAYHKSNVFLFDENYFKINKNLNIIHIRLNNRLVSLNHSLNWIDPEKLFNYLFKTYPDIKKWKIISDFNFFSEDLNKDINRLRQEMANGPNKFSLFISIEHSINYINCWIKIIQKYSDKLTIYRKDTILTDDYLSLSGGLNANFLADFGLLMKSENIMFWGSTFSWWASFLTNKSNIIIGSPWRMDRKPEFDPSLDKLNMKNVKNINLKFLRYYDHKKKSLFIHLYSMIPFVYRALYSKLLNYISKKLI